MTHLMNEKVKEYIVSNSEIALTIRQADIIMEQLYNAGYNLELINNQLQLDYVDQYRIHSRLVDIDNLIHIACISHYKKVMNVKDIKTQFAMGTTELTQYCGILHELCESLFKQHILDTIYKKTEAAQVLMAATYKNKGNHNKCK